MFVRNAKSAIFVLVQMNENLNQFAVLAYFLKVPKLHIFFKAFLSIYK